MRGAGAGAAAEPGAVGALQALVEKSQKCIGVQAREAARRHGLTGVAPALARLLSLALEAHLSGLLRRAFALERQHVDAGRRLPGMAPTSDTRRQVGPGMLRTWDCLLSLSAWHGAHQRHALAGRVRYNQV